MIRNRYCISFKRQLLSAQALLHIQQREPVIEADEDRDVAITALQAKHDAAIAELRAAHDDENDTLMAQYEGKLKGKYVLFSSFTIDC
jgi:hypothetical protein